ncbi:MAG TPA: hypothetical protein VIQ54_21010 [Polyangia bacterium]|jgi:hypothetical protein
MIRFEAQDAAVRTTSATAQSPAAPYAAANPADALGILERATAILERQTAGAATAARAPGPQANISASAIEDLRQQARDWIDRVLAIVGQGAARDAMERVSAPIAQIARLALPFLSPAGITRPGDIASIPMRLMNDAPAEARPGFAATDLLGDAGHRIPASAVSFWPAFPIMQPGEQSAVEVRVTVPTDAHAGNYSGLIQIVTQPDARTLFSIKVG